jgi:hypothetical protein
MPAQQTQACCVQTDGSRGTYLHRMHLYPSILNTLPTSTMPKSTHAAARADPGPALYTYLNSQSVNILLWNMGYLLLFDIGWILTGAPFLSER